MPSGTAAPAWVLIAALALGPRPAASQAVRGALLDRESGAAVAEALVLLVTERGDTVARTISDERGAFTLSAPSAGAFWVLAATLGYRTAREGAFSLSPGGEVSVEIRLEPEPISIAGIEVERMATIPPLMKNGFFERLKQGHGFFITPADIESTSAVRLTQLLAKVPFLTVVSTYPSDRVLVREGGDLCAPSVLVDGVLASEIQGRRGSPFLIRGSEGDLEALVQLKDVEAVEVYRGGREIPGQFAGMTRAECGLIVIWTRRR